MSPMQCRAPQDSSANDGPGRRPAVSGRNAGHGGFAAGGTRSFPTVCEGARLLMVIPRRLRGISKRWRRLPEQPEERLSVGFVARRARLDVSGPPEATKRELAPCQSRQRRCKISKMRVVGLTILLIAVVLVTPFAGAVTYETWTY